MSDDVKYKVISSAGQLPPPPPLRKKLVVIPEWEITDPSTGEKFAAALWVFELTAAEHGEYAVSDRVFDEFNQVKKLKPTGDDLRFLSYVTRDPSGQHRLWPTLKEAEEVLGRYGKHAINTLTAAAREVNYGSEDTKSEDEAVASAEKNSETEIQTAA
jgi:hypothetical protein